eukprot:gene3922-4176_t
MLPAEVVHYGPPELDPVVAAAMQKHAVATNTSLTIIDGLTAAAVDLPPHPPLKTVTGFKTKVHALAFVTSFDHVLLLDSDNTPLADPTYLFDSAAFRRTGNLFWLDFWTDQWMDGLIYNVLGLDVPWEASPDFRASEAGQLMLDRLRHYDVLEWLWLLNLHSGGGQGAGDGGLVGKCLWGDKDTYRIAFQLAGKEDIFHSVQHHPLQALARPGGSSFLHAGMVQRGLFGELLFLHRTAAGKMWPHCANSQGQSCIIWGVTTPVDQEQLLASVLDPTNMRFQPSKLDLKWQDNHCFRGAAASSASWDHKRRRWSAESVGYNVPDDGDGSFGADGVDASFVDKEATGFWRVDAADGFASVGVQAVGSADRSVVQQPLLLSVADGGDVQRLTAAAAAQQATILDCELDKAQHLLPIPAIAAAKLPEQVQGMLDVAFAIFYRSATAATARDVFKEQWAYMASNGSYELTIRHRETRVRNEIKANARKAVEEAAERAKKRKVKADKSLVTEMEGKDGQTIYRARPTRPGDKKEATAEFDCLLEACAYRDICLKFFKSSSRAKRWLPVSFYSDDEEKAVRLAVEAVIGCSQKEPQPSSGEELLAENTEDRDVQEGQERQEAPEASTGPQQGRQQVGT